MDTLDVEKLKSRIVGNKTYDEALNELDPFEWENDTPSLNNRIIDIDKDGKLFVRPGGNES